MYDTWYLSVSPDILNIPDIPDIPYIPIIPEIPITFKSAWAYGSKNVWHLVSVCLSWHSWHSYIPDIPDIPTIPEISIVIQISLRSWFRKGITLYMCPDIPEIVNIPSIPNNLDIS